MKIAKPIKERDRILELYANRILFEKKLAKLLALKSA